MPQYTTICVACHKAIIYNGPAVPMNTLQLPTGFRVITRQGPVLEHRCIRPGLIKP